MCRRREEMGNYQTKIVPNMPAPSQRIRDARMDSRYSGQGYRARRKASEETSVSATSAYADAWDA